MEDTSKFESTSTSALANLFDDEERKALFRKYLIFLGWLEILIFVVCWFYQLGTDGYDRFGPVEIPFPWRTYFLVAFLAPIAITFLIGVVIVGFNRYLGSGDSARRGGNGDGIEQPLGKGGRLEKVAGMVSWLQKLPYLALLLLLGAGIGVVYHLDAVMSFIGAVGEKTVKMALISLAVLLGAVSFFVFVLIVLNYKLRKRAMDYRYRTHVAERFGLVILDDNTVLNQDGQLLVRGKKWRDSVPLLTSEANPSPASSQPGETSIGSPEANNR